MPSALIIPGVQVRTVFEPIPPLPSATGILGVVGVADRGPLAPTPVGSFTEFIDNFGVASRYAMPEVQSAFTNGVSRAVIARLAPGRGTKAALQLMDPSGEPAVRLEARAEGSWGRALAARVTEVRTLARTGVKYVNLEIFLNGEPVERIDNLVTDPFSPNYLFRRINEASRLVTAVDPVFEHALPPETPRTLLAQSDARAAGAVLQAGGADVVTVTARRPGRAGNRTSIRVSDGRAGLLLVAGGGAPSLDVQAREPGMAGADFRVTVSSDPEGVAIVVTPPAGAPRTVGPAADLAGLAAAFATDPDLTAVAVGTALPAVADSTALARRVTIEVFTEGQDTGRYPDLATLAAIEAIDDPVVRFAAVPAAEALPDSNPGVPLAGGRSRGAALAIEAEAPAQPMLEFVPAEGVSGSLAVRLRRGISSIDNATPVVNLDIFVDDVPAATFTDLTMDPDDSNYLPGVVARSGLVNALDLFVRSGISSLPVGFVRPQPFNLGGDPVAIDDFQDALDRLEEAPEVDMVIASAANQLEDAGVRSVHQRVVAHCEKMAGPARNRIGLGSVTAAESGSVAAILDHANDVRSDLFALAAPAGMAPAVAGLLARLAYFEAPTFKNVVAPPAPPGVYTDAQLEALLTGNVCVVNRRRLRGTIVVKGVMTSSRQINVQRTVHKAVRDIDAIADRFIGSLNNEGNRNALRQQVFALLSSMERAGALVPSTDGSDPAFKVAVLSTQDDFAKGIVRVDVALRPVRAIDFIYVTIFVQT